MIKIAIPTGRLQNKSIEFLRKFDSRLPSYENERKLIFRGERFEIFLAKPWDLPLYVEERVADLGIVGRDIILEQEKELVTLKKLPFGYCKMVLAGFPEKDLEKEEVRIATKYPNIAKKFLEDRFNKVKIFKLNGSVELGPILKISDEIVDLMETGRTLKENGLIVKEVLFDSSACLISNISSFIWSKKGILKLLEEMEGLEC
ncbi:MAG TPA: ATP phosphoribosyltransferase [Dictyoglomaceae bacterium]|nr:ATP phosphoribosyltransferase [Dictyoglomaceae bacterium]HOL38699.1 ATP phosphoribosyltransferase [Dictyoglomaceae bacterium]HOP94597.1 ATP phosphoribosyltransferase [Dictyoglomaceae bacterium]HPP15552.1 ATP phosphoribosyltransferase [Dictyoglomaceae bacterium]HPU42867.1 ATP phosphoribosyltransferase [Dictyoglomaceae bacterium]